MNGFCNIAQLYGGCYTEDATKLHMEGQNRMCMGACLHACMMYNQQQHNLLKLEKECWKKS